MCSVVVVAEVGFGGFTVDVGLVGPTVGAGRVGVVVGSGVVTVVVDADVKGLAFVHRLRGHLSIKKFQNII